MDPQLLQQFNLAAELFDRQQEAEDVKEATTNQAELEAKLKALDITLEVLARCKAVFGTWELDGSGTIPAEKLGTALRNLGRNPSNADITKMRRTLGNRERIEFGEFFALVSTQTGEPESADDVIEAFKVFDTEDTGTISAKELKNVMKSFGESLTDAEIDMMIASAPYFGDRIDYEAFAKLLTS